MKFENYIDFGKHIQLYDLGIKTGLSQKTISAQEPNTFIKNIRQSYAQTHLYFTQEDAKKLLMLTKTPKDTDLTHLPYDNLFIDVNFTADEIEHYTGIKIEYSELVGMIIQKGEAYDYVTKTYAGETIRIITLAKNDEDFLFLTFNIELQVIEEFKDYNLQIGEIKEHKNIKKFCKNFAINFLNFVLDPEVITTFCEKDATRNAKRIKRGQYSLPSSTNIVLDGKRRNYINSIVSSGGMTYSYRFWVQGHYRILKSDRYKEKKGKKLWIPPFIKGKGVLFEKQYVVK